MAKRNLRQKSTNAQTILRQFFTTNQGNKMTFHAKSKAQEIRSYVAANPNAKPKDVAKAIGTGIQYVYAVLWTAKKKAKVKKPSLPREVMTLKQIKEATARVQEFIRQDLPPMPSVQIEMFEPASDPVNHPEHYKVGGIETIDFIEAKKLNYNIGNVVKYLTRADHKGNRKQDLEKALWYLTREINSLK
jgi:hypothetical protein